MSKKLAAMAMATGVAAASIVVLGPVTAASAAPTICEPGFVHYKTYSSTKSGRVTAWAKEVKNDNQTDKFTFSTEQTVTLKAHFTATGNFEGKVGLKKLAEATVGAGVEFGLAGEIANTKAYKREVTFTSRGKWVIWAGVYTGSGGVVRTQCNSNGTKINETGSGTGNTFQRARVTGLTNCAKPVSDRVEKDAKTKCG
ncbi:hypothetical protein [Streptomyces sp. HD]|uniref:hypothetical protein n=1 Tax=Streptomyces sp. HD TaxID=3020892 RepID=UPI00232EC88F|nr:hypothetical protein [Streptomyces sp. HD]MDC0772878.1 hypothetical protein [Streptomyces sp. HD]